MICYKITAKATAQPTQMATNNKLTRPTSASEASYLPTTDEDSSFEKRFKLIEAAQLDVDFFHRSMCEPEPKLCLPCPSESKPPTTYLSDRRQQHLSKQTGKSLIFAGLQFSKSF